MLVPSKRSIDAPVAVVGGGPVGLVIALAVARRGVPVVVIERDADEVRSEWRGSTIHPPTMDFIDQLGLAAPILDEAVRVHRLDYRDLELPEKASFPYSLLAGDIRYPFRLQYEQYKLVRLLRSALERESNVDIRFSHEVVGLRQDDAQVELDVVGAGKRTVTTCRWAVAADGAHSTVRKLLDVAFPGFTYPFLSLVVATPFRFEDVVPDLEAVGYWSGPYGRLSLIRTPDVWRAALSTSTRVDDTKLPDGTHPDFFAQGRLLLGDDIDPRDLPLSQHQMYRSHQRLAGSFRVGRVLLAGDAAHLTSTTGGMGLNSGIHDAMAAAAALASPDQDAATAAYATWRRGVAERYVQPATTINRTSADTVDLTARRDRLYHLCAMAADPAAAREFLKRASMLVDDRSLPA